LRLSEPQVSSQRTGLLVEVGDTGNYASDQLDAGERLNSLPLTRSFPLGTLGDVETVSVCCSCFLGRPRFLCCGAVSDVWSDESTSWESFFVLGPIRVCCSCFLGR